METELLTPLIRNVGISLFLIFLAAGIRIVRPIERGLIERLGKFKKKAEQGFHWIIPIVDTMRKVNITEQMVDVPEQVVQTSDKLNTKVDAVVYYQVQDVQKAEYNVDDHQQQLTSLARTTLRAVMGKLTLTQCIQERNKINEDVEKVLDKETDSYGVNVLRVEVQRIDPPTDVQTAMNNVVKAEQEKIAAKDFATAEETKADGVKRAEIKKAEGVRQGLILRAQGEANAKVEIAKAEAERIKLENEALIKYFIKDAQKYKALEVAKTALKHGTKYVIDSKSNIMNVMSDIAGATIVPVKK